MPNQNVVSTDILQDTQALAGSGNGTVGGAEVTRLSRSAKILELWVDVTAIDPGVTDGEVILEARLENTLGWFEVLKITGITTAVVTTTPKAFASAAARWGESPLGHIVRARYNFVGGSVTAQVRVVRKE